MRNFHRYERPASCLLSEALLGRLRLSLRYIRKAISVRRIACPWSNGALFNCLRMRFVKIGTDNEMPGRIKLSQPGRDNLPFRQVSAERWGKYVVAYFWSPRGASSTRARHGQGLLSGGLLTTMERARRTMEKDRRGPSESRSTVSAKIRGGAVPPAQRSSCAAPRVRAHREVLFSPVVARRAANGLGPRPEHPHRAGGDMYFSRSGLIKGIVASG